MPDANVQRELKTELKRETPLENSSSAFLVLNDAVIEYNPEPKTIDIDSLSSSSREFASSAVDKFNERVTQFMNSKQKHEFNIENGIYDKVYKEQGLTADGLHPKKAVENYLQSEQHKLVTQEKKLKTHIDSYDTELENNKPTVKQQQNKELPTKGTIYFMSPEEKSNFISHTKDGGKVTDFLSDNKLPQVEYNNHKELKNSIDNFITGKEMTNQESKMGSLNPELKNINRESYKEVDKSKSSEIILDRSKANLKDASPAQSKDFQKRVVADKDSAKISVPTHEKVTDKSIEPISERVAARVNEQTSERVADRSIEKVSQIAREKVNEPSSERLTDRSIGQVSERIYEPASLGLTDRIIDYAAEKLSSHTREPVSEKAVHSSREVAPQKSSDRTVDIARDSKTQVNRDTVSQKANEQSSERLVDRSQQPVSQKVADKNSEIATERIVEAISEPAYDSISAKIAEPESRKDILFAADLALEHSNEDLKENLKDVTKVSLSADLPARENPQDLLKGFQREYQVQAAYRDGLRDDRQATSLPNKQDEMEKKPEIPVNQLKEHDKDLHKGKEKNSYDTQGFKNESIEQDYSHYSLSDNTYLRVRADHDVVEGIHGYEIYHFDWEESTKVRQEFTREISDKSKASEHTQNENVKKNIIDIKPPKTTTNCPEMQKIVDCYKNSLRKYQEHNSARNLKVRDLFDLELTKENVKKHFRSLPMSVRRSLKAEARDLASKEGIELPKENVGISLSMRSMDIIERPNLSIEFK